MTRKYLVWCLSEHATPADGYELGGVDHEHAAHEGAEHYWSHCDGWESSWPLRGDRKVRVYEVSMEMVPAFTASKVHP